jgi:hypothetical protein
MQNAPLTTPLENPEVSNVQTPYLKTQETLKN